MDGMLSQDEINALLNGMNTDDDKPGNDDSAPADVAAASGAADTQPASDNVSANSDADFTLDDSEKDAVGEISNISMGTAATTLSSLLNQKVNITTPTVAVATWDDLATRYDRPCVMMQISYKEGLDGNNVLILKEKDVKIITDLMMGGVGQVNDDEPLSELHLSAIGEAMNQMMGSAATSMSSMFNRKIDISPPIANLIETYADTNQNIPEFLTGSFVMVAFKMTIGELVDSEIMQLYPIEFARELLKMFSVDDSDAPESNSQEAQAQPQQAVTQQQVQQPQQDMQPNMQMPPQQNMQQENIDLIKDVPLEVTVELGRTTKSIKEILEFAPGTIVELNKIAGEAIDLLVNGRKIAKGEVVVIEESFGVRITEIIKDR